MADNYFENIIAKAREDATGDKTAKVTAVYGDPVEKDGPKEPKASEGEESK